MKYLIVIFCLQVTLSNSQNNMQLVVRPKWENQPMVFDSIYQLSTENQISFDVLKFYISKITLLHDDDLVYSEPNSFHLVDASKPESFSMSFPIPEFQKINKINFILGIDSITNVSGAMGGDLDPMLGMYWTWQSGYINAKIEGTCSQCETRKNAFIFHLGGYKQPFDSFQNISLKIQNVSQSIVIDFDLSTWIKNINLSVQNNIMSPSENAVKLSKSLAENFKINRSE